MGGAGRAKALTILFGLMFLGLQNMNMIVYTLMINIGVSVLRNVTVATC